MARIPFTSSNLEYTGFGGGSSGGGNMEIRVARLESDVAHIRVDVADIKADMREMRQNSRSDFRLLITGGAAAFIALAGMLITGYLRLEVAIQAITK